MAEGDAAGSGPPPQPFSQTAQNFALVSLSRSKIVFLLLSGVLPQFNARPTKSARFLEVLLLSGIAPERRPNAHFGRSMGLEPRQQFHEKMPVTPTVIENIIRMGKMTALRKVNGGVRGVADVVWRPQMESDVLQFHTQCGGETTISVRTFYGSPTTHIWEEESAKSLPARFDERRLRSTRRSLHLVDNEKTAAAINGFFITREAKHLLKMRRSGWSEAARKHRSSKSKGEMKERRRTKEGV